MSIGSAVFAWLTIVTDRQTNRPRYSVGSNRPHLYLRKPTAVQYGLLIIQTLVRHLTGPEAAEISLRSVFNASVVFVATKTVVKI